MLRSCVKFLLVSIITATLFSSCITSRVKPLTQMARADTADDSLLTIFLLERDIPQEIERLGVVSVRVDSRLGLGSDELVKQKLKQDCQRLGANGAYRIMDGTYYPNIINYLVFKYRK